MISAITLIQFFSISYVKNLRFEFLKRECFMLYLRNTIIPKNWRESLLQWFPCSNTELYINPWFFNCYFFLLDLCHLGCYVSLPSSATLFTFAFLWCFVFSDICFFSILYIHGIFKVMCSSWLLVGKFVILFIFPIIQLLRVCVLPEW